MRARRTSIVEAANVNSALRALPAVNRLLAEPQVATFARTLGPASVKSTVTEVLAEARTALARGASATVSFAELIDRVTARLAREETDGLIEVINATGILLHTNLGRAPLAAEASAAAARIAGGYSNVEFDVASGVRGSRYDRVGALLRSVTGAADGLLVNNCAAAILLVLDTYAKERDVIVARNELIEIGGGFRLPDVLARSGATLVEVGTTNKVYLRDVERALTAQTALLLRSHPSNFRISGFVATIDGRDLAALGKRVGVTTLEDLGTGALVDLTPYGLPHERTVGEAIADGLDLVAFSGDKLLGGPQVGVIVGNRAAIARLRANPLLRALRVDKSTLAAFAATLQLYTVPGELERIPLYRMLALRLESLLDRARVMCATLGVPAATPVRTTGFVGGGTLPQAEIASAGVAIAPGDGRADLIAERLRGERPPIVGRVADGVLILDLRTVAPADDARVTAALARALAA